MKLLVIHPNAYNDTDHRADYYEVGDVFSTTPEYGALLIRKGLCSLYTDSPRVAQANLPVILPPAAFPPDMEQISNIGSLAPLMDVQGISLGHITYMVNSGINDMSDLKDKSVDDLKKLMGISQALAKQVAKVVKG